MNRAKLKACFPPRWEPQPVLSIALPNRPPLSCVCDSRFQRAPGTAIGHVYSSFIDSFKQLIIAGIFIWILKLSKLLPINYYPRVDAQLFPATTDTSFDADRDTVESKNYTNSERTGTTLSTTNTNIRHNVFLVKGDIADSADFALHGCWCTGRILRWDAINICRPEQYYRAIGSNFQNPIKILGFTPPPPDRYYPSIEIHGHPASCDCFLDLCRSASTGWISCMR